MKQAENNFTLLRLVLALLVVCGHFKILPSSQATSGIFGYADFAVDAFFIISGYLVYASYDKNPNTGSFYIRRMFRIYPLYFVTVVVQGLAMAIVAGGILQNGSELLRYWGFNLVMANFKAYDLGELLKNAHNPGINPSLWTLKIEVAFYLTLPLLWYLMRRFNYSLLIPLYIASVAYTIIALHLGYPTAAKQLPGKLSYFIVGFVLYRHRDSMKFSLPVNIAILAVVFASCNLRTQLWMLPVYPLCVGMIVFICALRLPAIPLKLDISYGVYLFHGPLIQFALVLGLFQDTLAFLLLLIVTVCIMATIAERLVERLGIALGHRLSSLWVEKHG